MSFGIKVFFPNLFIGSKFVELKGYHARAKLVRWITFFVEQIHNTTAEKAHKEK